MGNVSSDVGVRSSSTSWRVVRITEVVLNSYGIGIVEVRLVEEGDIYVFSM